MTIHCMSILHHEPYLYRLCNTCKDYTIQIKVINKHVNVTSVQILIKLYNQAEGRRVLRTGAIETFRLLPSSPHPNDAAGRNEVRAPKNVHHFSRSVHHFSKSDNNYRGLSDSNFA